MSRSILLINLILLMFGGATAGIIKVPDQYATIQAGINAAFPGDTVLVAAGTYYENIDFKGKAITVASHFLIDGDTTHVNNTIIDGSKPSDPNKGSVVSFVSGEDTTSVICGFTITGGSGTVVTNTDTKIGGGIYCYSSAPRIINNKITSNTVTYPQAARGGGVGTFPFGNNKYAIIENNIIELNSCIGSKHGQGGGIYQPHGKITHNVIRSNSCQGVISALGGGIHAACDQGIPRYLHITKNTIENNQCTGTANTWCRGGGVDTWVVVLYLMDNKIQNNQVLAPYAFGGGVDLVYSSAPSIIQGNTIAFNSATGAGGGIELIETQGVQIIGNRFEGNDGSRTGWGGGGIDESDCSGNLIKGNFIKGNIGRLGGGIFSWNATVINNIIVENKARIGGGICCWHDASVTTPNLTQIINNTITGNVADTAGGIATHTARAVVMNTICWGNTAPHGPEIEMWGGTLNAAYSDIRLGANGIAIDSAATVNWLAGNIDSDPQLNESANLLDSSPCIGAGIASHDFGGGVIGYCPGTDINGKPRPDPAGSNPDIGASESPLDKPTKVLDSHLTEIPHSYFLAQNYPNPFNPATTIEFTLPKPAFVSLKVYNLLGEEVATLVSEEHPAGIHKFNWDARGLASGVYLYRLEAGSFRQSKKLILMR